jgi:type II secretory pathway component PulK
MKNKREKGFILIFVIILITLIGFVLSFLTTGANTMLYQSNTSYLQACERNLVLSGLEWAKRNIKKENRDIIDKMIELDVTDMDIRDSNLTVTVRTPAKNQPEVQINTSCSRGRKTLKSDDIYKIR